MSEREREREKEREKERDRERERERKRKKESLNCRQTNILFQISSFEVVRFYLVQLCGYIGHLWKWVKVRECAFSLS